MPKREIVTTVSITFTDSEYNELVLLHSQLDAILADSYPTVTEQGLNSLIANLEMTLKALKG